MLDILNLILILVIIIFLVVFYVTNRIKLAKMQSITVTPTNTQQLSLLDLREFSNLNPTVKDVYRNYIADKIFGAMMNVLSTNLTNNQIDIFLKENDTLVSGFVQKIVDIINKTPPFPPVSQDQLKAYFSGDPLATPQLAPTVTSTQSSTQSSTQLPTVTSNTAAQSPTVVVTSVKTP